MKQTVNVNMHIYIGAECSHLFVCSRSATTKRVFSLVSDAFCSVSFCRDTGGSTSSQDAVNSVNFFFLLWLLRFFFFFFFKSRYKADYVTKLVVVEI